MSARHAPHEFTRFDLGVPGALAVALVILTAAAATWLALGPRPAATGTVELAVGGKTRVALALSPPAEARAGSPAATAAARDGVAEATPAVTGDGAAEATGDGAAEVTGDGAAEASPAAKEPAPAIAAATQMAAIAPAAGTPSSAAPATAPTTAAASDEPPAPVVASPLSAAPATAIAGNGGPTSAAEGDPGAAVVAALAPAPVATAPPIAAPEATAPPPPVPASEGAAPPAKATPETASAAVPLPETAPAAEHVAATPPPPAVSSLSAAVATPPPATASVAKASPPKAAGASATAAGGIQLAFARPFTAPAGAGPRISVVLTGLGPSPAAATAAIRLPGEVTLGFASYARNLQAWIDLARAAGHEVLLDIPMEPVSYPRDDPGPLLLLTSLSDAENLDRLAWHLSRATGYVGVTHDMGSRFTASAERMRPILAALKARGLLYLDSWTTRRSVGAKLASAIGMPWVANDRFLDPQASRPAITEEFAAIQRIARRDDEAIAIGHAFPITLDLLNEWLPTLRRRGFVLAPVSALARR